MTTFKVVAKAAVFGLLGLGGGAYASLTAHPFPRAMHDLHARNASAVLSQTSRSLQDTLLTDNSAYKTGATESLVAFLKMRAEQLNLQPSEAEKTDRSTTPETDQSPRLGSKAMMTLAQHCAPTTPASVLRSIAQVESGFAPLTIGINGRAHHMLRLATEAQAVETARTLLQSGQNLDLGLMQINGRNLSALNLSVEDAFDPCHSLKAAGELIDRNYARALSTQRNNRSIMQMAYSIYNTGNPDTGWKNGYIEKIEFSKNK